VRVTNLFRPGLIVLLVRSLCQITCMLREAAARNRHPYRISDVRQLKVTATLNHASPVGYQAIFAAKDTANAVAKLSILLVKQRGAYVLYAASVRCT